MFYALALSAAWAAQPAPDLSPPPTNPIPTSVSAGPTTTAAIPWPDRVCIRGGILIEGEVCWDIDNDDDDDDKK